MRKIICAVVVLLAMAPATPVAFACDELVTAPRNNVTVEWAYGLEENKEEIWLAFRATPGNIADCLTDASCETYHCETLPDSPFPCTEPQVGHCVNLELEQCQAPWTKPVIRRITHVHPGPC